MRALIELVLIGWLVAGAQALAEVVDIAEDATARIATLVPLPQDSKWVAPPLDKEAPKSVFVPGDGEKLWREAKKRALAKTPEHSGGLFDFHTLVPDDFRAATNFRTEMLSSGESDQTLSVNLTAAEAERKGNILELRNMRMVYFIADAKKKPDDPAVAARKKNKPKTPAPNTPQQLYTPGSKPKKEPNNKGSDPSAGFTMPGGGRMIIIAAKAEINLDNNEGYAYGGANIEIFPKPEEGKENKPISKLASPFIRWRSWYKADTGSDEFVLYTCSNDPTEIEPFVRGSYINKQLDGTESTVVIQGRGMVFESGKFQRLTPIYDEDKRTAGLSLVAHSRAIFHSDISTEMTASTIKSLIPFQQNVTDEKKPPQKKTVPDPEPEITIVHCKEGPAIFDFAHVPLQSYSALVDPNAIAEEVRLELPEIVLGKRYDFLNGVTLEKRPLNEKPRKPGDPDMATNMSCLNLRIQYPPAGPNTTSTPDYTEAIGGVNMAGYKPPPAQDPNQPPAPPGPPEPFVIECERMYYDGPEDGMYLVGGRDGLARVKDNLGAAFAQQFCYRSLTQTLTMPSKGLKRMIMQPTPPAPGATPAAGASMLGSGVTTLTWTGPLSREIRRLPVPHQKDVLKEVMTLNKDVVIEQKEGGLRIYGNMIRLHRDLEKNQVEYLEASGDVESNMGDVKDNSDIKAIGNYMTVDMAYNEKGELSKNIITVLGDRKAGIKADVFKGGGTAVRADKFIIDRVSDDFAAYGGAVAVVKSEVPPTPAAPKPETAQGASGMITSIKFESGGDIFIQCDGDFIKNGKTNTLTVDKNVLIRQPGMNLLADKVLIELGDPPAPLTDPKNPNAPKALAPSAAGAPASALFSGDLKSIECSGKVELTAEDKLIHSDWMHTDKEDLTLFKVNDPEDDVRVYIQGDEGGDRVLCARESLRVDQKTGSFTSGGQLLIMPYKQPQPASRGAVYSPARRQSEQFKAK